MKKQVNVIKVVFAVKKVISVKYMTVYNRKTWHLASPYLQEGDRRLSKSKISKSLVSVKYVRHST